MIAKDLEMSGTYQCTRSVYFFTKIINLEIQRGILRPDNIIQEMETPKQDASQSFHEKIIFIGTHQPFKKTMQVHPLMPIKQTFRHNHKGAPIVGTRNRADVIVLFPLFHDPFL